MRRVSDPLRIAIVGAGAAGIAALNALVRRHPGAHATVFDIGRQLPRVPAVEPTLGATRAYYDSLYARLKSDYGLRFPPVKTQLGNSLPRISVAGRKRFFISELQGGLTNLWGGLMLPFDARDLHRWPIRIDDLAPFYAEVAALVGISGEANYATRPPIALLAGMDRLRAVVERHGRVPGWQVRCAPCTIALETRAGHPGTCIRCGECMAGCALGAVYNAAKSLQELRAAGRVAYQRAEVLRFAADGRQLRIRRPTGDEDAGPFHRVFLAAGCPSTTAIILRSMGIAEPALLQDNAIFQLPLINFGTAAQGDKRSNYLGLSGLSFHIEPESAEAPSGHAQLYLNFDYLWRGAMPESLWPLAAPLVHWSRDRLMWLRVYLDGAVSWGYRVYVNSDGTTRFEEAHRPSRAALRPLVAALRSALGHDRFWIPPLRPVLAPTSSHLGATFPYGGNLVPVAPDGQIAPGVHVCDATCFPTMPATSPTFTIMANAARTVAAALA